jgi:hypothetical protein
MTCFAACWIRPIAGITASVIAAVVLSTCTSAQLDQAGAASGASIRASYSATPTNVAAGDPIQLRVRLTEHGRPLPGADVRASVVPPSGSLSDRRVVTIVLRDDGAAGDAAASDGEYTGTFEETDELGTYTFRFEIEAERGGASPVRLIGAATSYVHVRPDSVSPIRRDSLSASARRR